jgi:dephospho-CoA kinase
LFVGWAKEKEAAFPYVIEEAAILFESGVYKDLDFNILVYAPEELRISRVISRDNIDREKVKARMQHQMRDEEKINMADAVIYNDESRLVLPQILEINKRLTRN